MSENREFIKSYSNYVLKKKHQNIDSGSIFERDITTIGGLDQFAPGQIPMYKSSNFIITVNNEMPSTKDFISDGFEEWNLKDIKENENIENEEDSLKIVLKQNYYKLKDFAYFGSCVELIRASLLDIINNFPGELYVPTINGVGIPIYYNVYNNDINEERLGDENLILVDNPFKINIHTRYVNDKEITNPLKYMCNNGFSNYCNGANNESITWSSNYVDGCKIKGEKIADIVINGINIYAYIGNENEIYYLTDEGNANKIIARPKKEFINKFYSKLDYFEKVLMNPNSKPKYTALFEVISENSYGYETELRPFTFPLTYGDYNIATYGPAYESYVQDLYKYANFYDENFCDNLYRSMTHEAIKNFDWSFTRKYQDGDEKEYVIGGNKMKKALRIFAREFDEIKLHIDGIKDYNSVNYGENNLLPDYFLSDTLDNLGWNINNIFPFDNTPKQITKLSDIKPYSTVLMKDNLDKYGYFLICNCNTKKYSKEKANESELHRYDDCADRLVHRIKKYSNEKEYSINEVNNFFLKNLILNSKSILRKKGTIEGIESILSLLGMKSKRMRKNDADSYDYEIKELETRITEPLTDSYVDKYGRPKIDWYNSTKTIAYNTNSFRNGVYIPYQGLLVEGYIKLENGKIVNIDNFNSSDELYHYMNEKNESVKLFPYFSYDKINDGNPYYQMNGGWLKKSHKFTINNEMVEFPEGSFTETHRDIRNVDDLDKLVKLPIKQLKNNDIVYVKYINGKYVSLDGIIYEIYDDEGHEYVKSTVYNGIISFGIKRFSDEISVSERDGSVKKYNLNTINNNTEIRAYIINDNITISGKYYSVNTIQFFNSEEKDASNYFILNNKFSKNKLGGDGWCRLKNNDKKLKFVNSIINIDKGNNPHNGKLNYDGGNEYLDYYKQIFKYSIENDKFNENCYDNLYDELEDIKKVGFEFETDIESTKIKDYMDIDRNDFNSPYYDSKKTINTKYIEIIFNNSIKDVFGIKFLDYVIMNYMQQMLPSTVISKIKYVGKDKDVPEEDFTHATLSFDFNNINACGLPLVTNVMVTTNIGTHSLLNSDYTVLYSESSINNTTNPRNITASVTTSSKYGNLNGVKTAIQGAGPCNPEVVDDKYIYTLTVDPMSYNISPCEKDVDIIVKGSYTINGKETVNEGVLSNDNYIVDFDKPLSYNTSNSEKTYKATVKGIGKYKTANKVENVTITQSAKGTNDVIYKYANLDFDVIDVSKCFDNIDNVVSNVKLSNLKTIGDDCSIVNKEGTETLTKQDYQVSFNPNGENNTNGVRQVEVTVTTIGKYGSLTKTKHAMQDGPCNAEQCEDKYFYDNAKIAFKPIEIGACSPDDTKIEYVKLINVGHQTTNCDYVENDIQELTADNYEILYGEPFEPNNTKNVLDKEVAVKINVEGAMNGVISDYILVPQKPCIREPECVISKVLVNDVEVLEYAYTNGNNADFDFSVEYLKDDGTCNKFVLTNENGRVIDEVTISKDVDGTYPTYRYVIPNNSENGNIFYFKSVSDDTKFAKLILTFFNECTINSVSIKDLQLIDGMYHYELGEKEESHKFDIIIDGSEFCSKKYKILDDEQSNKVSKFKVSPSNYQFKDISDTAKLTIDIDYGSWKYKIGNVGNWIAKSSSSLTLSANDLGWKDCGTETITVHFSTEDETIKQDVTLTNCLVKKCKITKISVLPIEYKFNSEKESKEFKVDIECNNCEECKKTYNVSDEDGRIIKENINTPTFSLKNTEFNGRKLKIFSTENTNVSSNITLTKYVKPECKCEIKDISIKGLNKINGMYEYELGVDEESHNFDIIIDSNQCDKCNNTYKVLDDDSIKEKK